MKPALKKEVFGLFMSRLDLMAIDLESENLL